MEDAMSKSVAVESQAPSNFPGNRPAQKPGVLEWLRQLFSNFFTQPKPAPAEKKGPPPAIGIPGQPLRVLAFAGGGLDTVMQLGVAHALLVGRSQAPQVVAGVSAGAVNAVALAEILQAGASGHGHDSQASPNGDAADRLQTQRVAQVSKFREIFEAFMSVPGELLTNSAPDPYEVNARAPLRPQELPIHNQEERQERMLASGARYGLVRLFNGLLSVRLQFSTLTVMVRRILELVQIREVSRSWLGRLPVQLREGFALWWLLSTRVIFLSPLVFRVLVGVCFGGVYRMLSELEESKTRGAPLSGWQRFQGAILKTVLGGLGLWWRADSAKEIITQSKCRRFFLSVLEYLVGAFVTLFLFTPLLVLLLFAARAWYPPPYDWVIRHCAWELWTLSVAFLVLILIIAVRPASCGRWTLNRLLASFDLETDLLTPFVVKPVLVRLFDRDYYGKRQFNQILNAALKSRSAGRPPASGDGSAGRTLRHYVENRQMPIYVAPAVANIARTHSLGQLEVAGLGEKVVDALLAACAITPFFRAQQLRQTATGRGNEPQYYIDASNVANDPSFVILRQLRRIQSARMRKRKPDTSIDAHAQREDLTLREGITGIEIYPVAPFRVTQDCLETPETAAAAAESSESRVGPKGFSDLVPTVLRSLQLRRFQDAKLERKFIQLYCRALPANGGPFFEYDATDDTGKPVRRVAAGAVLKPIETDQTISLNIRILGAKDKESRRTMVAEAVADGCRAALQVMLASTLQQVAGASRPKLETTSLTDSPSLKFVRCCDVMRQRLSGDPALPGSAKDGAPGLPEVCRHCAVHRDSKDPDRPRQRQLLEVPTLNPKATDWPHVDTKPAPLGPKARTAERAKRSEPQPPPSTPNAFPPGEVQWCWPRKRDESNQLIQPPDLDRERPTVSFLFSGGVFRGVFQVGVVNALNEAGLRPDLLAGASVGTITSAMVGSVFRQSTPEARQAQVAKLAAVFLAIDRLVLTDRFADFFRRFTLRAAEARFSFHDMDQFFRRFDQETFGQFNKGARRVIAGLERVFDLNPFELTELTRSIRNRETSNAWNQLSGHVGQFLERYGIGDELLGAEPLALLIREVVLSGQQTTESAEFDLFLKEGGFHMLATATNLTQGKLETLSSLPDRNKPEQRVLLKEGLLASSAFPAVFRPRWSWEVHPQASTTDKFVDGGVMDNLPLDAVVRFLWKAYERGLIQLWPKKAPHLLFTASLQAQQRQLQGDEIRATARNWSLLQARAKRLSYNQKIDRFAEAQQNFRAIALQRMRDQAEKEGRPPPASLEPPDDWDLLNMEAVVVKPEWLVGTFAFNPMLGFRRHLQAASIAHGCAATMRELARRQQRNPGWAAAWGIHGKLGADRAPASAASEDFPRPLSRTKQEQAKGLCWFRNEVCPFSRPRLMSLPADCRPPQDTIDVVQQIYHYCGNASTHRPEAAKVLRP
jgi:predicted acylesterase/phospholipase RssA